MDSGLGRNAWRYIVSFGIVGLVAEYFYVRYALVSGAWAVDTTGHLLSEAALVAFGYGLLFFSAAIIWRKGASFSKWRRDSDPRRRLKSLNATLMATIAAYGLSVGLALFRIATGTPFPDLELGSIVHLWVLYAILIGLNLALRPGRIPSSPSSSRLARHN